MAQSFLFSIAESVLGKLGSLALEEFFLAWGLESDLEKIRESLKVIKAVLLDAEQQLSLNPRIEIWLENLKQVLYDAEDVVDEFKCEALRRKVVKSGNTTRKIAKSVRHVSFPHPESLPKDVPKSLQNLECMRTICFINERREGISSEMFIKTCCSRFQYLRVLGLSDSSFEELPASIGNLKHLKYLSLWRNSNIKRLPNSICKLQSLQILLLNRCWNLQELPKDIRCMINLRYLWITTRQIYFPTGGIGCLKSLRFLFITECHNLEYLFEDMQGLKKLRRLVIFDCKRLISLPQSIKCLTTLDTLCIDDCKNLELRMEEGEETQFSLVRLELRWLPKIVDFPEWLIRGSANSLKVLEVERCNNLRELPNCLQNMASHPEVRIIDCPKLNNNPLQKAEEAAPSTSLS